MPGASGYAVVLALADGGAPVWIQHSRDQNATVYPVSANVHFVLRVATVGADGGVSAWTQSTSPIYIEYDDPSVPAGLSAVQDGGVVELTWAPSTDSASGVARYDVEGSRGSAGFSSLGAPLAASLATTAISGAWRFRVRARDAAGNISAFSAEADLFIDVTAPPTPSPPVPRVSSNSVALSWGAVGDSPDASTAVVYELERSPVAAPGWVFIATSPSSSAVDAPGEGDWEYRVRAVDAFGNASAFSLAGPVATIASRDAGIDDAGAPNAGESDGGMMPAEPTHYDVSCGCSSGGAVCSLLGVLFVG